MYFVTSKKPGYVLFCMTPSGRAAIGLAEQQRLHLLERKSDGEWQILKEWPLDTLSHTDLLLALRNHDEPENPRHILNLVPQS